jgi:hypothetical protein
MNLQHQCVDKSGNYFCLEGRLFNPIIFLDLIETMAKVWDIVHMSS